MTETASTADDANTQPAAGSAAGEPETVAAPEGAQSPAAHALDEDDDE